METSILNDKVILIVDDYQINTELLSLFVADTGAIPLTASNGKECLEIVKQQKIDMILMDCHMPVMDGIEATRAIRALPDGKDIVIIGVSGSEEGKETDVCLNAGMNLVVVKLAFSVKKLIEIAEQFFSTQNNPEDQPVTSLAPTPVQFSLNQSNSISDQVIIDYEKALIEFENDNDLLISLILDFNKIVHTQFSTIRQALDKADFEFIQRESHGIKGGAANLCALPLYNSAKSLESACRENAKKDTIAGLIDDLARNLDLFDSFVKTKIPQ